MARDEGSKVDNIDFRFAMVDTNGVERYPFRMRKRDGRFGFAIGDDHGGAGGIVQTIEEVIRAVVHDGQAVRTSNYTPSGTLASSQLKLGQRQVVGFRVAPSLAHLVAGAQTLSLGAPSGAFSRAASTVSKAPLVGTGEEPLIDANVDLAVAGAAAEIAADPECQGVSETERRALINARIGQGRFRERMLKLWEGKCAVTGLSIPDALVASHALPWKESSNEQRLDAYNGLLLSATVDRLFDRGLISFSHQGKLLVRESVSEFDLTLAGVRKGARLRKVPDRCRPYLKAHRERFGYDDE